jgi:hypothetical protein
VFNSVLSQGPNSPYKTTGARNTCHGIKPAATTAALLIVCPAYIIFLVNALRFAARITVIDISTALLFSLVIILFNLFY